MTPADIARRFAYSYWANRKLFAVVDQLTPSEFTQTVAGSYGSVRNTLVHMLSAEWGWVARCGGPSRGPALKADDYPTFESIIEKWLTVEGYVDDFLVSLTDDDLQRVIEFDIGGGPKSAPVVQLLEHALTHSVHHRGQLALLLRVLGYAPGNVDLLFYDAERAVRA